MFASTAAERRQIVAPGERAQRERNPEIISPLIPEPALSRREMTRVSLTPGAIIAPLQGAEIFSDVIQGRRAARLPLATFCRRFAAG